MKNIDKLEMMRAWALSNGIYDYTEYLNDVIDEIIELKRDLNQTKEELERLKIRIKQ